MKKIIALILTAALLISALCGCGGSGKKGITFPEDELLAPYRSGKDKEMQTITDSENVRSVHFYRGETQIYGDIYVPDGDGPVVLISGGFATPHYGYGGMAEWFAQNGIVGVVYDPSDMGGMGINDDDFINWSPLTEAADIEAIITAISKLSFVDNDKIFLWGHSMGGFASAYVGFRNPDLIRGLILIEPAFYLNVEAKELFPEGSEIPDVVEGSPDFGRAYYSDLRSFDIYDFMPGYGREVVIFAGTMSPSIGVDEPECLTRAAELLPSGNMIRVLNADHYFAGEPMSKVAAYTVFFVNEISKDIEK